MTDFVTDCSLGDRVIRISIYGHDAIVFYFYV
jgi:hypothetical protein